MENENYAQRSPQADQPGRLPAAPVVSESPASSGEMTPQQKRTLIILVIVLILILVAVVASIVALAGMPSEAVAHVRDIFIIFMALMSLMTGLALGILMIQLARLTNLLQNEIKPILNSLNETINHLRGTTVFLSDNLTEPVIKLNEYLAGISQLLNTLGLTRKKPKI
ncbi:MAG: hypothetical protein JXA78_19115 [Anaerolineales bacterium]|nr:hypothetical protein [Anaerolineales bacterium]